MWKSCSHPVCPLTLHHSSIFTTTFVLAARARQILLFTVYSCCRDYVMCFGAKTFNSQSVVHSHVFCCCSYWKLIWLSVKNQRRCRGAPSLWCYCRISVTFGTNGPLSVAFSEDWACWVGSRDSQCTRRVAITSADISLIKSGCISRSGVREMLIYIFLNSKIAWGKTKVELHQH